ncbi:MAG TPA: acetylglucosamine-6-sulfatase [Prolixibacteraceae bacterium]|nr:acetylglucosamine-6-sulfatase [Prolixibacteraceae bacterium]
MAIILTTMNIITACNKSKSANRPLLSKRKELPGGKSPNILFIMADDLSTQAVSIYKQRYAEVFKTPNLDRIGKEGCVFTNTFATNPICAPSRATILTGQYSQNNGVRGFAESLDKEKNTVPKMLQGAGYETAIIGKWHLREEPQGFNYYNVFYEQGEYFDCPFIEKGSVEWPDAKYPASVKISGHVTDVITDMSIKWIENRDKDKPFALMVHHKAPHGPFNQYDPKYNSFLANVELPVPESLYDDESTRSLGSRNFGNKIYKGDMSTEQGKTAAYQSYQNYVKNYLRLVRGMDDNVGRLLDYLDKEGLSQNTVVVFTSDQGMFLGEHTFSGKRWVYEESIRMPLMIRYPVEIPANSICHDIITNVDFAPMLLDYASLEKTDEMQGRSFRDNALGDRPYDWQTDVYSRYWLHLTHHNVPAQYCIRTDDYKLILFYGLPLDVKTALPGETPAGWELYDLKKDPCEMHNVYNDPDYADVVRQLKQQVLDKKITITDIDSKYPQMTDKIKEADEGN